MFTQVVQISLLGVNERRENGPLLDEVGMGGFEGERPGQEHGVSRVKGETLDFFGLGEKLTET